MGDRVDDMIDLSNQELGLSCYQIQAASYARIFASYVIMGMLKDSMRIQKNPHSMSIHIC
jgi:hypothetical protein